MFALLCYIILGLIAAFFLAVIIGVAKQTPEQRAKVYEDYLQKKAQKAEKKKEELNRRRRYYMSKQYEKDHSDRVRNWLLSRL